MVERVQEVNPHRLLSPAELGRESHFAFYTAYGHPWLDVCARVDVTELMARAKTEGYGVFPACLHAAMRAINHVPQLRQRITPERQIAEFDKISPTFTVTSSEGIFNFAYAEWCDDAPEFTRRVRQTTAESGQLDTSQDHRLDLAYVTCLPWLDFSSIQHPRRLNGDADSVPRVAWGKITVADGGASMPVSLSAHHGLVDGAHVAAFFEAFRLA